MSTPTPFDDLVNIERHKVKPDVLGTPSCGPGCILEVASDTVAVKACMAAWIERLMREEGLRWEKPYFTAMIEAKEIAFAEILKGKP
jgi:hypothetical protein